VLVLCDILSLQFGCALGHLKTKAKKQFKSVRWDSDVAGALSERRSGEAG
jgi:hypothetical protein